MTILEVKNLYKDIKKKRIIEDVSFKVKAGEIVGFLGPNGAGKTTTIKMIMGLFKITEGTILVDGIDVQRDFEKAMQNVGGIVENPDLYKTMTGMQNLKYFGAMHQNVTDEDINQVVELVKMKDRINDKVKTYSLGMRQRIGLAQALLHKPKVLILDEPTNGLDPLGIKELRDLLKQLSKMGVGILVSSHLLSEMEMMCDRIYVIDNGKLIGEQKIGESSTTNGHDEVFEYEIYTDDNEKLYQLFMEKGINTQQSTKGVTITMKVMLVPGIIKELVEEGIQIYAFNQRQRTLEEDFISITNGTKGQIR